MRDIQKSIVIINIIGVFSIHWQEDETFADEKHTAVILGLAMMHHHGNLPIRSINT